MLLYTQSIFLYCCVYCLCESFCMFRVLLYTQPIVLYRSVSLVQIVLYSKCSCMPNQLFCIVLYCSCKLSESLLDALVSPTNGSVIILYCSWSQCESFQKGIVVLCNDLSSAACWCVGLVVVCGVLCLSVSKGGKKGNLQCVEICLI
jgi:hypothetical protein